MENMLKVLNKEMPIHMHAHRSDDICTAIRIAQEYDVDLVLVHCTDGIAIADYLAKFPYPVIVGPGMTPRSKHETWNKTYETAGVLSRAGLKGSPTKVKKSFTPQHNKNCVVVEEDSPSASAVKLVALLSDDKKI